MKSTGKTFGKMRRAVLGCLAHAPIPTAVMAGIALWSVLGFAIGFARNLDATEGAVYAVVIGLPMGLTRGIAGGMTAWGHIENMRLREDVHRHPFLCMLPMQVVSFLPYAIMLHLGGIAPGDGGLAVATIAGALLCAAIGARGHTTDSRGWDVFWQGGGLTGLIASKLDNIAYGPSPLDA